MFKKIGYSSAQITPLSKDAVLADPVIVERMTKLAHDIKGIAPRSDDFLYFSIIFLKAAESCLLDDSGNLKKVGKEKAWGYFDEKWKWHGNVALHANNNKDAFPELELKKAHMNWVGKPLCKDHESSSVDGIRGIILDTYYDDKMKQVVGLCALDRVNYADLAKKVETGIVRYGSMGCGVSTSVCSECQHSATTSDEYCQHVKGRTAQAEINVGLKPIEYSLVVQPAEPGAILLRCIASLQDYKKEFMNYGVEDFNEMLGKLSLEQAQHLNTIVKTACGDGDQCSASDRKRIITSFLKTAKLIDPITVSEQKQISMPRVTPTTEMTSNPAWSSTTAPSTEPTGTHEKADGTRTYTVGDTKSLVAGVTEDSKGRDNAFIGDGTVDHATPDIKTINASRSGNNANINKQSRSLISTIMEDIMTESELKKRAELRRKLAYHQGGSDKGVEPSGFKAKPFSFNEDKHMKQTKTMGPVTGEFPGDMKTKEKLSRAELEERQIKRLAYFQGGAPKGVEPAGYKSKPFSHNEDKFMKQTKTMGPVTGEFPGDVKIKEKQKRAAYEGPALSTKLSWPKTAVGTINKSAALFEVFAGDKKVIAASGHEIFGDEIDQNWDFFTSKEYGQEVCKQIRTAGISHVAGLLKGAQAADPMSAVPAPVGGAMAPPAPPMPEMPMGDESAPEMGEKELSPKEQVEGALTEMEGKIDEARQALGNLGGESGDVNITVDKDGAESGSDDGSLKLSHNVASQLKTVIAEMNESADELAMISETYAGANRLSEANREDLDKIATASLREASGLLGKSGTLVKMASALSKQLTKVAQVAYSENAADDVVDEDDASDLMEEDGADDEMTDEADDAGVSELMAQAMVMRRNRREQLVVEAAKKMDPKAKAKMEADKAKAKKEKEKAKVEEDEAKDKMRAKAEKEKAKAKADAEAEKEKAAKKNKTAALRDMVDSAFTAKKEESDKDSYKIKLRRAYDVAIEMQKKGLIAISKTALDRQVDDIMEFDDKAFEAIKRTVANARSVSTVKTASDLGGVNVGSVEAPEGRPAKSTSELLTLLWK